MRFFQKTIKSSQNSQYSTKRRMIRPVTSQSDCLACLDIKKLTLPSFPSKRNDHRRQLTSSNVRALCAELLAAARRLVLAKETLACRASRNRQTTRPPSRLHPPPVYERSGDLLHCSAILFTHFFLFDCLDCGLLACPQACWQSGNSFRYPAP